MSDHFEPVGRAASTTAPTKVGLVAGVGLTDAARDQATGYIERRKSEMARFIIELAKALRGGSNGKLGAASPVQSSAQPFVEGVAHSLDALSQTIEERGVGDLYRDVETAARRHPEAALVTAFAAGLSVFYLLQASTSPPASTPNRPRP